jgi:hypothetical protein
MKTIRHRRRLTHDVAFGVVEKAYRLSVFGSSGGPPQRVPRLANARRAFAKPLSLIGVQRGNRICRDPLASDAWIWAVC